MKFVIIFIITLGLTFHGLTQNLVKDYKRIADRSLRNYFDTVVIPKIICDHFIVMEFDKQSFTFSSYKENQNKRLIKFSEISFNYSLYNKSLKDTVRFFVWVDRNYHVTDSSSILENVPLCIRISKACNFISADSAQQIAITDSIKYAGNLDARLERNKFDKEYCWVITGHEPRDKPKKGEEGFAYTESISGTQRRIINATTGQIIPYTEFDRD